MYQLDRIFMFTSSPTIEHGHFLCDLKQVLCGFWATLNVLFLFIKVFQFSVLELTNPHMYRMYDQYSDMYRLEEVISFRPGYFHHSMPKPDAFYLILRFYCYDFTKLVS